jgi:hypothetical protein
MFKFHFTANTPTRKPTRYGWVPNVEGWVFAQSIDHAEGLLQAKGWRRISLTRYNKDTEFQPHWATEGCDWVEVNA